MESLKSFEFYLSLHFILIPFILWSRRKAPRFQYEVLLISILGLPSLLVVVSCFDPLFHLGFYLRLSMLTLSVSAVNIYLFSACFKNQWHALLAIVGSLLISFSPILFSPSLQFIDPFWGVLPGTISLDALLLDRPFFERWILSALAWGLSFLWFQKKSMKTEVRAAFFLVFYYSLLAAGGFFQPGPWMQISNLKRHFHLVSDQPPFHIYYEASKEGEISRLPKVVELTEKLQSIFKDLEKSLPHSDSEILGQPEKGFDFSLFIYQSDRSKGRAIGAQHTQIGNFYRKELHLSEINLESRLLAHELSHLIHGQMKAPLLSYIDPFRLEGFAVALSAENLQTQMQMGAAFLKASPQKIMSWPQGFHFFSDLPAQAAYGLAGAAAAYSLSENKLPWDLPALSEIEKWSPSDEQIKKAAEIFKKKSIFKDPDLRLCAFLENENREDEIKKYCARDQRDSIPKN